MRSVRLTSLVVVVVVLAVLLVNCGRSRDEPAAPTLSTELTTSTTLDPFAVPETVDVAYLNRVLAALDAANGDIVRLYIRERRISPEIGLRIKALYGAGAGYDFKVGVLEADRDTKVSVEPGNRITKVTRLITASRSCIYTQVERDYRPVAGSGGVSVQWVGLRPAAALEEFRPYNPTHWIYTADGFQADRSQPPNPCTGS